MSKLELWFYRGLANITQWVSVVVFLMPSLFLLIFLMREGLYWLGKAEWIRITLCTLGNAMGSANPDPHVNVFVLHQFDRCDVNTGVKGLDLILNYYINELPLFVSVPIYTILGMIVSGWLAGKFIGHADKIQGEVVI